MNPHLEQRLSHLTPRTALPFRQLLTHGQISEETVELVLDAGELAGDRNRLIGFAAGFLHLRAQGVAVHDVIRMAKTQQRRVNLAWSPARWKAEHERLSRAEALYRLAAQQVDYDMTRYAAHLPVSFPGYLIRNSRRLGMEGLRQRHCVASYHDLLVAGSCAIASVFLDKARWTVELRLCQDESHPLQIAQIKSRHNGLPSAAITDAIHHMLGIERKRRSDDAVHESQRLYLENLRRILPVLREQQIRSITVSFEGTGDSGSIENIAFDGHLSQEAFDALPVTYLATGRIFDEGVWRSTVTPTEGTMHEAIEALTYDYLEETGVDWYNCDGGYGELEINVTRGTVELQVSVRYSESHLEYSGTYAIETGELL